MKKSTQWTLLAVLLLLLAGPAMARTTVAVSTDGFNRFTFNKPFNQVVLPPHTPLATKPVAMMGNKTLLISLDDDAKKPVQMVVQLQGGEVVDLLLKPGASQAADWQQPGKVKQAGGARPQTDALVDLVSEVLADPNRVPHGFHKQPVPSPGHIAGLTADFIANYTSQDYQVLVMRLRAASKSPVIPQDLYVRGVAAVYIDGDTVGPNLAPLAVVLKAK